MLNYACACALNHLIIPSNQELKVHVNLQEKRREGEEDRKREEFKAGYGLMPLIPVHSKKTRGLCSWNHQSELYRKILSQKPKKGKTHRPRDGKQGKEGMERGEYIKLTNLVLCSYLYTASPTGMHLSRNASFTCSLLADITALIWESLLLCA